MNFVSAAPAVQGAVPGQVQVESAAVCLFAAAEPAEVNVLFPAEREVARRLSGRARQEFLRGRAAMKASLGALGLDLDTSRVRMPHRNLSLTHAADVAVAAFTANQVLGVGVDFEAHGPIAPRLARYFLTERELGQWPNFEDPQHGDALLRLWTVKEALFKATYDNEAFTVRNYETADPWAWQGSATLRERPELTLRYVSMSAMGGYLSVAAAFAPPHRVAAE